MPGKYYLCFGALIQAVLIFFGLGLMGFGNDHLTVAFGNFTIAKIVFGIGLVACTMLMTHGYYLLRDGILILKLTNK